MKTASVTPSDIKKKWLLVDASGQTVGRLSTEIARVLRGKHKPSFVRHLDCGDNVVVINAEQVKFSGNKLLDKVYYWHTGFIGGIKAARAEEVLAKHPDRIIRTAVKGMLPKNKLGRKVIKNLKIYAGSDHPHSAQNPEPIGDRIASKGNS